ncbi:hypothetical protein LK13_00880 [Paenibacillus polymyxa]|nr:hypothetical protein LK13_00880 [Paenibacillus polymyxa]KJK30917.1 hypothetical protein TY89_12220 [Paenibacillus polymyxa]KKD54935.1 hypothetical protein C400_10735 [Paenibacillus sp. ICGEB2008]
MAISEWLIDLHMYKLEITLCFIQNFMIFFFGVTLCALLAVLFRRATVGILTSVAKLKVVLG